MDRLLPDQLGDLPDVHDLIGVPWVLDGRSPASGLDCTGLVLCVLDRLGIIIEDPLELLKRPHHARGADEILEFYRQWRPAPHPYQAGDVATILHREGAPVQHLGVMLNAKKLIHTARGTGAAVVTLERLGTLVDVVLRHDSRFKR